MPRFLFYSVTLSLILPISLFAQEPEDGVQVDPDNPVYSWHEKHDPNGTGKFYLGREIARVMSYHGAPWLERPEREKQEKISLLIDVLDLKPGMTVIDLGAGSGRISFLMAPKVGPKGTILAVDIQDEMLALIEKKIDASGISNVIPVKGKVDTTGLKPNTADLIIMVDVYHELEFPHEMLADFAKILKPGGRVAWVEYRKEDPTVPIKLVHKMTEKQVKKEASQKEFGLKFVETIEKLPQQHVVIFQKPKNE
ncbi:MAG: methyltransferase domain-containing protein [Planctomycetaceae bacterium]|nr:methyltransferase domain-containing protein [Planctomycetaceae bacterium]